MGLGSTNHTVSIEYCAGFSSTSILERCHKHESKIINRANPKRYWYITASGHLVENGNPIEDSRDIDFSYSDFECLGFFRNGNRVEMFNDLGEFRLKLYLHHRVFEIVLKRNFPNHLEIALVSRI